MMGTTRNYLDHAATSWPKPELVYLAMDQYAREIGAAAGRGEYRAATAAGEIVAACRRQLMQLITAADAREIAFFSNGTTALNAAIFGCLRPGDHVVTSSIEHNSVLRPLEALRTSGWIRLDIVPCDAAGHVHMEQMLECIDNQTTLVALTHGSNVTGAVQDVAAIGNRVRETATLFLCDAAQTLGYLPVDVRELGIDLLAAPGHKGTCGPLGTGMLYVSPKAAKRLQPTIFGGTGSVSDSLKMPMQLPTMLEAGNLNVPAIAGWNAALEHLRGANARSRDQHRLALCQRMAASFANFDHGIAWVGTKLPIVSLVFDAIEPSLVGSLLDSEFSIDVRCGWHCAALAHQSIRRAREQRNTQPMIEYQGTLRLSAGHDTVLAQIDAAAAAIQEVANEL